MVGGYGRVRACGRVRGVAGLRVVERADRAAMAA